MTPDTDSLKERLRDWAMVSDAPCDEALARIEELELANRMAEANHAAASKMLQQQITANEAAETTITKLEADNKSLRELLGFALEPKP